MRNLLVILPLILLFTSCDFFSFNDENRVVVDKVNFQGLKDLKLTGVVYFINKDIGNGYHGRGIIRVNIIKSNITHYDPRDSQVNYYCIIKNNMAEIYGTSASYLNIGDTIKIDAESKILNFNNKNKSGKIRMWIGPPQFFKMIKTKGHQEF